MSAGGYVALPSTDRTAYPTDHDKVEVYPVSGGGDPVTIQGGNPLFEPGVAPPRLLLQQYPALAITIAATDGIAVSTRAVPDYISFATWLGSAAVYGTSPDFGRQSITIIALTSAGPVTTPLASEIGSYAWTTVAAPTRFFYSRKMTTTGGPAGVFYVDLPH